MPTLVLYVGSPWADDRDTLAKIFAMLVTETLDPMFEGYGDFCTKAESAIIRHYNAEDPRLTGPLDERSSLHFHGNFHSYSCAFSIYTDADEVIATLSAAILANKATIAYKEARDERRAEEARRRQRENDIYNRHHRHGR